MNHNYRIPKTSRFHITNFEKLSQAFQETRIRCSIRILSIQQQRLDTQSSLKFPGYFGLAGVAVKIAGTQAVDAGTLSCRSLSILYCFGPDLVMPSGLVPVVSKDHRHDRAGPRHGRAC
ncbi:hypothetical protein L1987_60229 [Smallanthus sonchifolius]|uniref:Uncharacterized protein n=1 Tax=Smallanthus sonchifolius TaxID=185202 RepID=A0ACB9D7J1_9ASTR|nr:hypothetical protein L1987_60229 [Smallanthus sonchifolius]